MDHRRAGHPEKVTRAQWRVAREAVRQAEAAFSRQRSAIVATWQGMPMVEMDGSLAFVGPNGRVTLLDLFNGRRLLFVYHFWFEPGQTPCEGCTLWTDDLGDLGGGFANLHRHDAEIAFVSRATSAEIARAGAARG